MKFRNRLVIITVILALLLPGATAFAASSINLSVKDCAGVGARTTAQWQYSGGTPSNVEFRLCRGSAVLATTRASGGAQALTIPGKLLSKPGEYTLRVRCKRADGTYATDDVNFTVPADACPTKAPAQPTAKPTAKPTARPTAKPAENQTAPVSSEASMANEVIRQVNQERAKSGLGSLSADAELTRAACVRAAEIVQSFSHTRPDGAQWSTVSSKARGENIAKGQQTADKVMAAWMSSEGHRANILRTSYKSIGVCAYRKDGIMYWVQLFGN